MEVDKSRAALTSGETPLPLCGGEAELTFRAALTSGETPLPLCRGKMPLPLCGDDQERRSGVSPLCTGTGATERRSGVSPLCAGTVGGNADVYHPSAPNFYTGRGEVKATYANLPHWNRDNTACFVTFRLHDSIPAEKWQALDAERKAWLAAHPQPWEDDVAREYHQRFSATAQKWLDNGYGSCLMSEDRVRLQVEQAVWHFAGQRYDLYAFVVMPNHVHVLFQPFRGCDANAIVSSWKSFTSHGINRLLGKTGTVWQKESFDTLVRNDRHFHTIIRYIRENDLSKSWSYDQQ